MKAQVSNVRLLDGRVQSSQHVIDEDGIPCGGEEDILGREMPNLRSLLQHVKRSNI
jgi:hypothetical protein